MAGVWQVILFNSTGSEGSDFSSSVDLDFLFLFLRLLTKKESLPLIVSMNATAGNRCGVCCLFSILLYYLYVKVYIFL